MSWPSNLGNINQRWHVAAADSDVDGDELQCERDMTWCVAVVGSCAGLLPGKEHQPGQVRTDDLNSYVVRLRRNLNIPFFS